MTPGETIAGKYLLIRPLGQGSMGEIWAARHTDMGREVALKLIFEGSPELAARLKREAQACGRLEHPNIVRVYDIGETDAGDPFLVMERLSGETLEDRLARARMPPVDAIGIALDVARALRSAHGAGIVHRDLKPANVYLHRAAGAEGEVVKVLDFGVSKDLSLGDMRVTTTGALVGSPAYMSPEQARSLRKIDARADLWSLGVLLFEMLAGARPFQAPTVMGVVAEILAGPIPRLSSRLPAIDPRVDQALNRCLMRNVEQRMPSAAAFIDALRPVQEALLPPSARPPMPSLLDAPPPFRSTPPGPPAPGLIDEEAPTNLIDVSTVRSAPPPAPGLIDEEAPTNLIDVSTVRSAPPPAPIEDEAVPDEAVTLVGYAVGAVSDYDSVLAAVNGAAPREAAGPAVITFDPDADLDVTMQKPMARRPEATPPGAAPMRARPPAPAVVTMVVPPAFQAREPLPPPPAPPPLVTMGPQAAPNPGALWAPVTMGPQAAPNPGALRAPVTMGPQAAPNPGALRALVTMGPQAAPNPGALRAPQWSPVVEDPTPLQRRPARFGATHLLLITMITGLVLVVVAILGLAPWRSP